MPGPGEYRPDPTEGITRVDDLPRPNVSIRSRNYRRRPCPRCGHRAYRDRTARRTLHDLGDALTGRPRDIVLIVSQHYCSRCRKYFNADTTDLADPGSHYTRRVVVTAVRLVVEDGLPYRAASWSLWRDHRVFVPYATIQNWVEVGGEKGGAADRHRSPRLGPRGVDRQGRRPRRLDALDVGAVEDGEFRRASRVDADFEAAIPGLDGRVVDVARVAERPDVRTDTDSAVAISS